MVKLTRIYTRTGDTGQTGLGDGSRVAKTDHRVASYGTVDELNALLGVCRLHAGPELDDALARIQNDLFDVGADLCTPEMDDPPYEPLRVVTGQVEWLEAEIDRVNAGLETLRSFVLPAGSPAAAHLHHARTVARRAERETAALATGAPINVLVLQYLNRLSDYLFVLAREANHEAGGDVLWQPGEHR
ncbi:ATP:cob(I)alamin adenosyltransferase [Spiribacter salinus M19-40]|uniref:Corrinoid adenosyltransferase n=1 Tax=Spiribacter salinus M19-40 TaxID=1260251 RepID=R4VMI1_9GAMM|nr:cob(I)yrinic acid a,c-diamide adenosyltransferase [Spiribacter salinus]AGM41647.1 ATP:cob(I)alamin adenosyltransferase [Spiribacter salinus M19-40]MDR9413622.1 cob(I)yrinic acid a,c-diamide adenosyltransferase [Spiribacter sp.]MDR9455312.1 cob(I)yrinic acid a,c-diamide adenosyltransferase [Spiribacter sp.]